MLGVEEQLPRESDLEVVYQRDDGSRFALMIEDKVEAGLQPDQAKRYRLRAERERSREPTRTVKSSSARPRSISESSPVWMDSICSYRSSSLPISSMPATSDPSTGLLYCGKRPVSRR